MREAVSQEALLLLLEDMEGNLNSAKDLALFRMALLLSSDDGGDKENDDDDAIPIINNNEMMSDGRNHQGLPALLVPLLDQSVQEFLQLCVTTTSSISNSSSSENLPLLRLKTNDVVKQLHRILRLYLRIAALDPTLNEELGMQGAHRCLSQIITLDTLSLACCSCCCQCTDDDTSQNNNVGEENQDIIMELQDLACEVATYSKGTFPLVASPLTADELRARLPLRFDFFPSCSPCNDDDDDRNNRVFSILINQVKTRQSAQKDVGFVMWPSSVVLAQWLVDRSEELLTTTMKRGTSILELGAGCGLVGLVASKQQQQRKEQQKETSDDAVAAAPSVILSDFNDVVVKNLLGNLLLNDVQDIGIAKGLDFYQHDPSQTDGGWLSLDGERMPPVDLILASDVICQPDDAFAVARTMACALKVGGKAIMVTADSKHRFGVEQFPEACDAVGCLSICSRESVSHLYKDIVAAMTKTSGFVEGMALTMYTIEKTKG